MKKPEDYKITKYDKKKFEKTGILDCFQDVNLSNQKLTILPFSFGIIDGYFYCGNNNFDIDTWIENLEKYPKQDIYSQCDIVQDNTTYENTLKSLKMKQNLLNLINS